MHKRMSCITLSFAIILSCITSAAHAADVKLVTGSDLQVDRLRSGTSTYLVYMYDSPESGVKHSHLTTSTIKRNRIEGVDAWIIEQSWIDESGIVHSAQSTHDPRDMSTLAQTSTWNRQGSNFTTIIDPKSGIGRIEGEVPEARRELIEAGFASMHESWWFNWHVDLALLPLLPFDEGARLRLRVFDVGMAAPKEIDYTVLGSRLLIGSDGSSYDCWLIETDSGSPGSGNFQRFWIDKKRHVVVKEEDTFNGMYRSKILLSVPAVTEFPASKAPNEATQKE